MSDAPSSSAPGNSGARPPAPGLDARGLPVGYRLREGWEVSPREVEAMIGRGEVFTLIDCRTPLENQIVKLPGSTLLPLQEAAGDPDALDDMKGKGGPVIVYCHHGVRSLQMAMFLRQQGVADVKSMAGGIDLWAIDVEPGMRRY